MRQAKWWQDAFETPDGDLSIARLHLAWGLLVLALCLAFFLCARADAWPPLAMFVNGLIVLLVGGVAQLLEVRIERWPDPASWPASLIQQSVPPQSLAPEPVAPQSLGFQLSAPPPVAPKSLPAQNEPTKPSPYWLDIAVLQLVLGAGAVPLLSGLSVLKDVGGRLIIITIASEFVYLAFLSAQLVQKNELDAIFKEIRKTKEHMVPAAVESPRPAGEPSAVPETDDEKRKLQAEEAKLKLQAEEAKLKLQAEEEKLKLLQDRARILMGRIGRTFATVKQSDSGVDRGQAREAL